MNIEAQSRIDECKKNRNSRLDLSYCELSEIPREIEELYWLESLDISNNQLSKIKGLENLTNLRELYLSNNQLLKIEGLGNLTNLEYLDLSDTQVSKIEDLDNLTNLEYLDLSDTQVSKLESLDNLTNLESLDLSKTKLSKIGDLDNLKNLTSLYLGSTKISQIAGLDNLTNLTYLSLGSTQVSKIEGLDNLINLTKLGLANTQISKIENLDNLTKITALHLCHNKINKIEGLDNLTNLGYLDLSETQVSKIEGLGNLKNLMFLDLSGTQLSKVEGLENLTNLKKLYLGATQLSKITDFPISFLEQLDELDLSGNPIEELPESALKNVKAIIGFLKAKKQETIINRHLKVNILGDGRIGKTQLFNYLNCTSYVERQAETHGTNTTDYIFNKDYQAKVWDFGGQSYHHGFHHIFIRPSDFNIVLWVNDDKALHNFSYWLGTARNYAPNSPLFLVQNVWSEAENKNIIEYPDSNKLKVYSVGLDSVFAIDVRALHQSELSWQNRHDYFIASLHQAMEKHTQTNNVFREIAPQWLEIKNQLEQSTSDDIYLYKRDFKEKYANGLEESDFEILLIYLEFSGNILYFQGNECLREYIFINLC